jgi:hypothetical protein
MAYTDTYPLTWKKLVKNKFTANDALIVAVNLIPLLGVWFWNWDAKEMFLVYCLESVIAGLYTVLQMTLVALVKKKDVWDDRTGAIMPGFFFIIFFIIHFGLFLFVQLSIFLSVLKFPGLQDFGAAFSFIFHFPKYLSTDAMMVLLIFVFSYGVTVTRKFLWTGNFKTISLGMLMFTPYPRIFVQQFVVILGSFVIVFGNAGGKIFMLVFVLIKILFELIFDFDRLMNANQKQPYEHSQKS